MELKDEVLWCKTNLKSRYNLSTVSISHQCFEDVFVYMNV